MKQLGVLLLPPGQDASPSRGHPPGVCRRYPFIHLGEERQSGVKFLVQENNGTGARGLSPGPPDPEFEVVTTRLHTPPSVTIMLRVK